MNDARGRGRLAVRAAVVLLAVLGALLTTGGVSTAQPPGSGVLVRTVPAITGVPVQADGAQAVTGTDGSARLPVQRVRGLDERLAVPPTEVSPDLRVERDRALGPRRGVEGVALGLRTQRLVQYRFAGPEKETVAADRVTRLELRSNTGETVVVEGADVGKPLWLAASRTQQTPTGLISKDLYWTVSHVVVDGAEVVNKGQQKFVPNAQRDWVVKLLFYQVHVTGLDAVLGGAAGAGIEMVRPDRTVLRAPFADGRVELANVPRGDYDVRVYGAGLSFVRPVNISKDQELVLEVITFLDIALVATLLTSLAVGLVLVGRRERLRAWRDRGGLEPVRRVLRKLHELLPTRVGVSILIVGALGVAASAGPASPDVRTVSMERSAEPAAAPLLAYYYIWFNPTSWNRAKRDYPLLGRYSSADAEVMRAHVAQAKAAGLRGFLVSWKHNDFLDPRLEQLIEIARQQDFALGIVYQGLDFQRNPLPAYQVAADVRHFATRYANDPVFRLFGEPVVVITGTERFTVEELAEITDPVRSELNVLASAKNVEEYERTAALFDGDAYYWSSGDPSKASYATKLRRMAEVVRSHGGLWLAPAPAGFDARDLDGHRVVARRDGDTLRDAVAAAGASDPDAVAVISWNEFSENSHIEPSEQYGAAALRTLAELSGRTLDPAAVHAESDEPGPEGSGIPGWAAIGVTAVLATALLVVSARRRRTRAGNARSEERGP